MHMNKNLNMNTIMTGAAITMVAGTAAYMAMKQSPSQTKMKRIKKTTGRALKTVGSIVNDISGIIG